ncbi:MAG: hypothetical protein RSD04_02705 [Clostridia bacterium]
MKIEKDTIFMELLLGEIHAYWMEYLFKNIWVNPRNNDFYLTLKFDGTKILHNDIRTESPQEDIGALDILDGELVDKNHFRFEFEQEYTDDDDNDINYSIEFEFSSFEWDVIGIKNIL